MPHAETVEVVLHLPPDTIASLKRGNPDVVGFLENLATRWGPVMASPGRYRPRSWQHPKPNTPRAPPRSERRPRSKGERPPPEPKPDLVG